MTDVDSGSPNAAELLPIEDPTLRAEALDLDRLATHWAPIANRRPLTAEGMRGADRRAQRHGVSGRWLMEQAGCATAAAARALIRTAERATDAPVLVLSGPGNNGGDGFVAARYLALDGFRVVAALVASHSQALSPDGRYNWDRLADVANVERIQVATARDAMMLAHGIERVSIVIDALLGTGVQGALREPIRAAVDLIERARGQGVAVLAVDTPTAVDLTSGVPSEPAVRAHATITFHRPKVGLLSRSGALLAGRVLVAPIGIPLAADPDR